jgi:hypothetical protein
MRNILRTSKLFLLTIGFIVLFSPRGVIAQEGLLDGSVFLGQSREKHKSAVNEDELRFANGNFYSITYGEKGFEKGVYLAKAVEKTIYFEAEIVNPKQGKITWRGIIQGESIAVSYRWRKKGWLSDTVKDFTFDGTLKK